MYYCVFFPALAVWIRIVSQKMINVALLSPKSGYSQLSHSIFLPWQMLAIPFLKDFEDVKLGCYRVATIKH